MNDISTKTSANKPASGGKRAILALLLIAVGFFAYNAVKEKTGALSPAHTEITLAFPINGRISQMYFAEQAAVKKGDILAVLDRTPFEQALASARAQLAGAQADYKKAAHVPDVAFKSIEDARRKMEMAQHAYDVAHADLEQRQKLHVRGQQDNVYVDALQQEQDTKLALDRAQREETQQEDSAAIDTNRDTYAAALQQAQANVAIAETNLAETQLVAPSDGTVSAKASAVGASIAAGTTIYRLSVPKQ